MRFITLKTCQVFCVDSAYIYTLHINVVFAFHDDAPLQEEARAKPPSPVPQQAKSPEQPSKHVEPSKHVAPTKHVPNTTNPLQGSGGHVQNSPAAQPAKKQAAVKADTVSWLALKA